MPKKNKFVLKGNYPCFTSKARTYELKSGNDIWESGKGSLLPSDIETTGNSRRITP